MPDYKIWLKYRKWFLRQYLKKHRTLTCRYCGKTSLSSHTREDKKLATLDHVVPISKGGRKFDSNNIVVACYSCNMRKKDKDLKEFVNLIV